MASVTERYLKDGTRVFEIRVSRGRDPVTGKQLTPYSTRYTPPPTWSDKKACKQAQIEAAKFECDCKAGKVKTKAQKQQEIEELRKEEELKKLDDERRPTFKRYVEMLLEEMAVTNAPGTLENYDYVLRRAGPVFNDYKMEDITPAMIKKYIVDFQANGKNYFTGELVGHKTVLKHFIILHRIFASAVENDVLQVSPMQKLKRSKPRKDEIAYLRCVEGRSLFFKPTERFEYRGAFLLAVGFRRVLLECCRQSVSIPSFEEDKVFWNIAGFVLFQSKVNAVLPRNTLKILDVLVGDLDVGDTLVLSNQFLNGLLSARLYRPFTSLFLAIGKVFGNGRFQNIGRHFGCVDGQRDCSLFNFFLQ